MKRSKNKKSSNFCKILSFILIVISVLAFSVLLYFEAIPNKYLIMLGIVLGIIVLFVVIKLNIKTKTMTKVLCSLLSFIIIFVELIGIIYAFGTIDFLNNIFDTGYRIETYAIYTNKDNSYKSLKDLNNKKIIFYTKDDANKDKLYNKVDKKIKYEKFESNSLTKSFNSIINKENDALIINENIISVYEEGEKLPDEFKLIDKIDLLTKTESDFKSVNVTKESFVVYISGVDTTGSVKKSARSDVNILAFVNPSNGKILLVNTPRDYYLTLASKNAKDKLTHAGIYGTQESANSLAKLYETEVNYYARFNFTSFVKIIDSLGGVEVDVEKPNFRYNMDIDCGIGYICEQNSNREFDNKMIYIKSGKQKLNGEQALAYVRNRHQYSSGDNARGVHQEQVIKAVINKLMSPNTLTKYNNILKSLSNTVLTNIEQKTITKLINYQLSENINWNVESISVTGTDGYEETYSLGKSKAYVLVPDEESLNNAKTKIKEIME